MKPAKTIVAKTIVIVQEMSESLDIMAQWLRDAGYRVRVCTGPTDLTADCWAHTQPDCPLWKDADLAIYDPRIASGYSGHDLFELERHRHPDVPVLIWGPSAMPADVAAQEQRGRFEILPQNVTREGLVEKVTALLAAAPQKAAAGS